MKTRRFIVLAASLFLAIVAAGFAQPAHAAHTDASGTGAKTVAAAQATTYVVQPGDTLWSIARRFGVTVEALAAANGIGNTNYIYAGQVLVIPGTGGSTPSTTPTPAAGTEIEYVVQPGDTLFALARRFNTTVEAIKAHNNISNGALIFAGTVLKIVVGDKTSKPDAQPTTEPTPTPGTSSGSGGTKWLDVDLGDQTLVAYEGNTAVYRTLISSGTSSYPTPLGTFHVYTKLRYDVMRGGSGATYYYLPDVPHVMYFYEGGYAIHGAYWHTNFGTPMSHGCVNLSLDAAEWVYNWTPMGTTIKIHW